MATPTDVTQWAAGASGHNDNIAIGTFTQDSEEAETGLFVHCGFVPKMIFWMNQTYGAAAGIHSALWINTMPVISCFAIDDGAYYVNTDGFMGWDSSVVLNPDAQQDGGPPGTYGSGVVVSGFYYLKEEVAALSGGYVQDKVIGFKVFSTDYVSTEAQILGTVDDVFHYVAIG